MREYFKWLVLSLLICHGPLLRAEPARQYLDFSLSYNQGDYGTGEETELTQFQVTYGLLQEQYDFSLSLPYLFLSDPYGDDYGIGDVTLRGGFALVGSTFDSDVLYASVTVKFPTADESRGLGTGETDVGGFLTYTHYFGDAQFSLVGGYIVTGDSENQTYNDVLVYGVSYSKTFTSLTPYSSLDGHQNLIDENEDPLELSVGFYYRIDSSRFYKAEIFKGLNDSSPEFGVTVGLVYWF